MLVEGQDPKTPLRLETIGKGMFKGLLVLDRWMIEPSLNDLVTEFGPDLGLPKFYTVTEDAPALPSMKIHYSRCIRLEGIKVAYWQRVQENLWSISVLERLWDRMLSYDGATTGAAQLVYKAFIRTYKIEGMRDIIATGGTALQGLTAYVNQMRMFQGIEGITLMDAKDEYEGHETASATGLADLLKEFGQQLSGATGIPLARLFGQSPSGFNTGDTDMRLYYDTISQQQVKSLKIGMTRIYRAVAQSESIKVPEGFGIKFRSLWQMTETEKADAANKITDSVVKAHEEGLMSTQTSMKELKQSSNITGVFSNITDKEINDAEDLPDPPEKLEVAEVKAGGDPANPEASVPAKPGAAAPKKIAANEQD
jgi:phage-related protein (TIGR01555 family)